MVVEFLASWHRGSEAAVIDGLYRPLASGVSRASQRKTRRFWLRTLPWCAVALSALWTSVVIPKIVHPQRRLSRIRHDAVAYQREAKGSASVLRHGHSPRLSLQLKPHTDALELQNTAEAGERELPKLGRGHSPDGTRHEKGMDRGRTQSGVRLHTLNVSSPMTGRVAPTSMHRSLPGEGMAAARHPPNIKVAHADVEFEADWNTVTMDSQPTKHEEVDSEIEHSCDESCGDNSSRSSYAGANLLGKERPIPWNEEIYPLNVHIDSSKALMYGPVPRASARSDLPSPAMMVPRASTSGPISHQANHTGRVGCPLASQPLRLVPEFSTYVFKHGAADPPGRTMRYVHMGSVAPLPQGKLMVAYQGSQLAEGAEDQRIYLSFSRDLDVGLSWSDPVLLPVHSQGAHMGAQWGPVLHVHTRTGHVWLFYTESSDKRMTRPPNSNFPQRYTPGGDVMVTKTRDGLRWDTPRRIYGIKAETNSTSGIPKVIANNLLVAGSGTWMLPFWRESFFYNQQTPCFNHTHDCHGVLLSRDEGQTWFARGAITMPNTHLYEGTLAELGDGSIMMLFRTQLAAAAASKSWDDGETWSEPLLLTADNPDSKPNVINVWPHGEVVMAYNDHTKMNIGCRNCRSKLSISRLVNATGGWDHIAQFGPSPSDYLKVHYPSMRQHGCRLLVIYSSMYTCCAPYNQHCECAPKSAEVGLLMVSFKIWEDKDPVEQMMTHRLKTRKKSAAESSWLWGNSWWSDPEPASAVFESVLRNKSRA